MVKSLYYGMINNNQLCSTDSTVYSSNSSAVLKIRNNNNKYPVHHVIGVQYCVHHVIGV